jgi:hypothetical protein
MQYRYDHFSKDRIKGDAGFDGGPEAGEKFPETDLETIGGERIRLEDLAGRPTLITLGSYTCPMTAAAGPILRRLHEEFGGAVAFVTVYVREAYPGEHYPQPAGFERKLEHARAYAARDDIPWTVAVDDLDGTLHRALGARPNSAYVVDGEGRVMFRAPWSNDEATLREALEAAAGGEWPESGSRNRLVPLLSGLGEMYHTLELAGDQAKADVRREALPTYAAARLAHLFRGFSPVARGASGAASLLVGALGFGAAGVALARRAAR